MTLAARQIILLVRLIWDFLKGMYTFHFEGPCVTMFGSARLERDTWEYETARNLGLALGKVGFTIMTGGGPGLMEAANRGARDAGGRSVGCKVCFSFEERANEYLDRAVQVRYFFVRKVMLLRFSCAFIAMPGGFGTLDELFEVLTLIQTRKMAPVPVVLVGTRYWRPLIQLLDGMVAAGTIDAADLKLVRVTDQIDEVIEQITADDELVSRLGDLVTAPPRLRLRRKARVLSRARQQAVSRWY